MEKALLYKEWKKTKFFSIGILLAGIVLMLYMFLTIGRSFRFAGIEHLWDVIVNRKQFLFRELKYFPIAAGICMAVFQFVPEIIQKRIKLTLHLPLKENRTIILMLAYGLGVIMLTFILQTIALLIFASYYFPSEFVVSAFETVAPWYLSGVVIYLLLAAICLEPTWKKRILYSLLGLSVLHFFFLSSMPGAMVPMFWFFLLVTVVIFPMSLLSVHRFKQGNIN